MSDTFGKGMRVRVVDGEHASVEGVIFWWGRSKWGHGMRAGVTPDGAEDEKLWIDAAELRAIDEDGNELEPQPTYGDVPARVEIEIRGIDVPYALGRAITAVRIARGYPRGKASSAGVRLDRLTAAEERLGCRIPDAILAYVVAGLASTRDPTEVLRLTSTLHDARGFSIEPFELVAFGMDKKRYLAFRPNAAANDTSYIVIDPAQAFEVVFAGEIEERVLEELGGKEIERTTEPFEVIVDYLSEDGPQPEAPTEQWVTHKSFGRGIVVSSERTPKGQKLTVRFEDGETRKLLDSFVAFDPA